MLSQFPTLPPLPVADSEDAVILQNTYSRLQHTLLSAVDGQMDTLEQALREAQNDIKMTAEEKQTIAVELARVQKQVGGMNEGLARVRSVLQQSLHARAILESDRTAAEREIARLLDFNKSLQTALSNTQRSLQDSTTKLSHMNQVNSACFSSMKIQRRVEEKLKKELDVETQRRKDAEETSEKERKKYEEMKKTKTEIDALLTAQRNETSTAQKALTKMSRELADLTAVKQSIEKQWEDAVSAMSKRDETFQVVENSKERLRLQLAETETQLRLVKKENEECEDRVRSKEVENRNLQHTIDKLREELHVTDARGRDVRNELVETQVAESLYRQELDKVSKHYELATNELDRKNATVSDLKTKIQNLKEEFDTTLQSDLYNQVAQKEEQISSAAQAEIAKIQREEESKVIAFRHDSSELKLQVVEMREQLRQAQLEKQKFESRFNQLAGCYETLYHESQKIIYALERKEHDVNALKAKLGEAKEEDKTRAHQLEVMGIKRELEEKRKENERLQNLWLEAQKKGLAEKEGRKAVDGENEFLRTRLNIQETVKEKTEEVVKAAREEALEHKQEAAKLYMELKKSRVLIEELREANTVYERQLIETRARLEETYVTSDTASQMLKGEIRRLQGDRAALRKARIVDEKSTNGLERKYVLAREMVEKLRKERTELMKANWELKGKVEELERFVARFQSSVAQTSSNANATPQRPPWASLVSTPGGNMDKAAREPHPSLTNPSYNGPSTPHSLLTKPTDTTPDPHTLPDIESWRLKIDTLTRERSYLLSESQTLRSTIASLQSQLQNLTTTVQSLYPLRDKYQQLKSEMQTQQQMMQRKLDRAHALCAGLERQLRDAAPNRKVEYRVVDGEVGSARLVAALITPVSTADRGMSGSGGVGSAGVGGGFGSMALPMLRSR